MRTAIFIKPQCCVSIWCVFNFQPHLAVIRRSLCTSPFKMMGLITTVTNFALEMIKHPLAMMLQLIFLFFEIIRANNRLRKWVSKRQFTLFIGLQTRHRTINSGVAVLCFWINQNVIWSYFYPDWNHWAEYYILENFKWRTRDAIQCGFENCVTTANMQMKLSESNQRHTQSNRERVENWWIFVILTMDSHLE